MTPNEQLWLVLFLVMVLINIVFLILGFIVRSIIIKQFHKFRDYLHRNSGFGYMLIVTSEGRLVEKFVKFELTQKYLEDTYLMKSDCVVSFNGLPTLVYNQGDNEPINFKKQNMNDTYLFRSASFLDSLIIKIKAYAEAKAFKKFELIMTLLYVVIILCVISIIASGYGAYTLQKFKELILPMIDAIKSQISNIPIVTGVAK